MIKFFRYIRKSFLEQNKMGKYFKYAIGEIILVVIGILIALQINNWNEKRKDRIKEKHYISNLIRDLNSQIKGTKEIIDYEEKAIAQIVSVMSNVKKNNGFSDTTEQLKNLQNLIPNKIFKVYSSTFSDLQSSGNMSLISDKDLLDEINQYYIQLLNFKTVINENSNDAMKNLLEPLMDFGRFSTANMELIDTFDDRVAFDKARTKYKSQDVSIKRYDSIALLNLRDPQIALKIINAINFKETLSIVGIQQIKESLKHSEEMLEALERHANTLN